MSAKRVFVVGSLHYDILIKAPHLPQRDETVMGGPIAFACGGKGGNQAIAARCQGASVSFAGRVGDDRFGQLLLDNLARAGVEVSQIARDKEAQSGSSVAIIDQDGDYGAVVSSGANQGIDSDVIDIPDGSALLLLQNEIPETANLALARKARASGCKVILNAAPWRPLDRGLQDLIDILVVNRIEAAGLFGREVDDLNAALAHAGQWQGELVITLGAEGLVYKSQGEQAQHLPAWEVCPRNSHGAGDAFLGALAAAFTRDVAYEDALCFASAAAALVIATPLEDRADIDQARTQAFMASARLRA